MVYFSVLGPMEVRHGDCVVRLGGAMQQTLLASLLVARGGLVTLDVLTEELWGTTPPAKADNALQAQISRLRRTLAKLQPDRQDCRLTTTVSGYRLEVHPHELDAWRFTDTVEAIRARTDGADADKLAAEIGELRTALTLWRGPVFGGLTGGPLCQTAAARYEEARTAALELLYSCELSAGGHTKVISELTELVAQRPMDEQFCGLLMVALYRAGRQIDALAVYRNFRRRIADELGVDPSPFLRRYERAILAHDPLLLQV